MHGLPLVQMIRRACGWGAARSQTPLTSGCQAYTPLGIGWCAVPPTVGRGCPGLRVHPIRRTANNKLEGPAPAKVTRTLTQKKVGCRPESPMRRGSCILMPLRCIQYRRRASRLLKAAQNGLWLAELRMQSPSHAGG